MTAAWMWARAELRARWRSWIVLGLLAGATAGIVAGAVAGARRTDVVIDRYIQAAGRIDAAVVPNDPAFDDAARADVAALPEVETTHPFIVPFLMQTKPASLEGTLVPLDAATARLAEPVIVEGRNTDPDAPDEVVIDENLAERLGLGVGSTVEVGQQLGPEAYEQLPPGLIPPKARAFNDRMRVVGIIKSTGAAESWTISSGFADKHRDEIVGPTNMFVTLDRGEADFDAFQRGVQEVLGRPTNVERGTELLGIRKIRNVVDVERDGLLLFALVALLGGGVLVGQALVRAVTASAAELPTWRAMGADRPMAVTAMVLPSLLTAGVGAVTGVVVALALSPRFPIGVGRRYELDVGVHADVLVLTLSVVGLVLAVTAVAALAAWWRVTRGEASTPRMSKMARWIAGSSLPPSMVIGSRLAVEPGQGKRSVPVRSALVGAIVGVLGVVACFTFRAGIDDASTNPRRSGVVWDYELAQGPGTITPSQRAAVAANDDADGVLRATWDRAVDIDGVPVPTWGTEPLRGTIPFVVLSGRAPGAPDELVMTPTTLEQTGHRVGDTVELGDEGVRARIVGTALLPASSHTDFDQGAWVTHAGLRNALGPGGLAAQPENIEDYLLVRWRDGVSGEAAGRRLAAVAEELGLFFRPAALPTAVVDLGNLESLPLFLALFFWLLAAATVAHALVTTVRRRRFDLAVLRSIGFTRRQSRRAIAWQATLLAAVGLLVGIPLGIAVGRVVWRAIADEFPLVYVPPTEVLAVLVVVPVVLLLVQALAAGPAHAATRIQPAQTLRTE